MDPSFDILLYYCYPGPVVLSFGLIYLSRKIVQPSFRLFHYNNEAVRLSTWPLDPWKKQLTPKFRQSPNPTLSLAHPDSLISDHICTLSTIVKLSTAYSYAFNDSHNLGTKVSFKRDDPKKIQKIFLRSQRRKTEGRAEVLEVDLCMFSITISSDSASGIARIVIQNDCCVYDSVCLSLGNYYGDN